MKIKKEYNFGEYTMRLAEQTDFDNYYYGNFDPVADSVARFTGCKKYFTRDEVLNFFTNSLNDTSRVDFVILISKNKIIGEVVLSDIEEDIRQANFRIGIFSEKESDKGLGTWMIRNILEYGFIQLNLNRIYLDVFSFNDRAIHLYKKMGFIEEGRLRQSVFDGDKLVDDILMSILRSEWIQAK